MYRGLLYKFNGKELQSEFNINVYDLGARHYDPAIGRFMVMDPMADFVNYQSPYVMANNNPVLYVDDYGMGIINLLGALVKNAVNGVKSLFSGSNCSCKSKGESLKQAFRRPDMIFPRKHVSGPRPYTKTSGNDSKTEGQRQPVTGINFQPEGIEPPAAARLYRVCHV